MNQKKVKQIRRIARGQMTKQAREQFHLHVKAIQMMPFRRRFVYCWKILFRRKF